MIACERFLVQIITETFGFNAVVSIGLLGKPVDAIIRTLSAVTTPVRPAAAATSLKRPVSNERYKVERETKRETALDSVRGELGYHSDWRFVHT